MRRLKLQIDNMTIGEANMTETDSEARKAFNAALAKAQGQIEGASKSSENPHFKSKYADLASVWEACRSALTDNDLSVVQFPDFDGAETVTVQTILAHADGFERSHTIRLPVAKKDAQGVGSAITYARRYSLMAMVGIAPEDDDANAAVAGKQKAAPDQFPLDRFRDRVDKLAEEGPAAVLEFVNASQTRKFLEKWPVEHQVEAEGYASKVINRLIGDAKEGAE